MMLLGALRRGAAAVTTVLAVAAASGPAAADTRADMYAQLGVDKVGADYLFLIDESGSMRTAFPNLRKALDQFTKSIEPGDRVSFVPFGEDAQASPWQAGRSKPASAAVAALPDPGSGSTNFYEAMAYAVNRLAQDAGSGRVAAVVLLSDGDPAQRGRPECQLPPAATWRPLAARADALARSRPVNAYAIPITGTAKQCAGVSSRSILQRVFRTPEVLKPDGQTAAYLAQAKETARVAKARLLLARSGELTKTVSIDWTGAVRAIDPTGDTMRLPVRLSVSGQGPVVVSDVTGALDLTVTGAGPAHTVRTAVTGPSEPVTVTPGKPAELVLAAALEPPGGIRIRHQTVTAAGSITVQGRITSPWLDLAGGGLPQRLKATLAESRSAVSGTGGRGVPSPVWAVLATVLVLAVFAVAVWYYRGRPVMRGTLVVTMLGDRTEAVPLDNERSIERRLPSGSLAVSGIRVNGTPAMQVAWTSARGTTRRPLSAGGSMMIAGVSFRHERDA
jgi:hypothetical protein